MKEALLLTVTPMALILIGGILCLILVRLVRGSRYLAVILLTSYSLRVALTLGLYLVSAYEVPILRSLQLPGGFWRFTYDAPSYHANGVRIAEALRQENELPQVIVGDEPFLVSNYDFFYFVGLVYWVFGTHPLYVPLLNSMLWTAITVLGYMLAHRIRGESAGKFAVALIGFWPSPYIWSSQILKDSLVVFLLLLSLYLVIRIREEKRWVMFLFAPMLVSAVFMLTRFRFYLVAAMIPAVLVSLGLTLALRFREFRFREFYNGVRALGNGVRALVLIGLLWVPFLATRSVNPFYFLSLVLPSPVATSPSEAKPEMSPPSKANQLQSGLEILTKTTKQSVDLALQTYNIDSIDTRRMGYASTGGASNVTAEVQPRNHWEMVTFLPRGLAYALYAPFPWQWFAPGGDTGLFKTFAGVETLLMIAVTPFLLVGVLRAVCSRRMDAWTLLIFGMITMVLLALTVTNLGTLFRLRLQALIPLFIIVSAFGLPAKKATTPQP